MILLPTPLEKLSHPLFEEKALTVYVKRDDLTHAEVMGNKWRKLKYNLAHVKSKGLKGIVTPGGAHSNHIAATAALCTAHDLKSVGIIRGDELSATASPTLQRATEHGMETVFLDRASFRRIRAGEAWAKERYPDLYFVPEGGTNQRALGGCQEMLEEITIPFDLIVTPVGTGGTFCGLLSGLKSDQRLLGVSALKGDFMHQEIADLKDRFGISNPNYALNTSYHFGGYGKTKPALIGFMKWFKQTFRIQLDPIYTGKSFYAVFDMIKRGKFEKNLRIILVHTGGLQGIEGFNRKNQNMIA